MMLQLFCKMKKTQNKHILQQKMIGKAFDVFDHEFLL